MLHQIMTANFKTWTKSEKRRQNMLLQFTQSTWMKPRIMLNTKFRAKAKHCLENNQYKFLRSLILAKTIQNNRKQGSG